MVVENGFGLKGGWGKGFFTRVHTSVFAAVIGYRSLYNEKPVCLFSLILQSVLCGCSVITVQILEDVGLEYFHKNYSP